MPDHPKIIEVSMAYSEAYNGATHEYWANNFGGSRRTCEEIAHLAGIKAAARVLLSMEPTEGMLCEAPDSAFIDHHVGNAIVQRNQAEARVKAVEAALAKWKCPVCNGAKKVWPAPWNTSIPQIVCSTCEGTGLSKTSRAALSPASPSQGEIGSTDDDLRDEILAVDAALKRRLGNANTFPSQGVECWAVVDKDGKFHAAFGAKGSAKQERGSSDFVHPSKSPHTIQPGIFIPSQGVETSAKGDGHD